MSEQLGHSAIGLTADIYSSVMPQVTEAAAEAVAAVVPRAAAGTGSAAACPPRVQEGAAKATIRRVSSLVRGEPPWRFELQTYALRVQIQPCRSVRTITGPCHFFLQYKGFRTVRCWDELGPLGGFVPASCPLVCPI